MRQLRKENSMTGMPKLSPDVYSKRRAKFMEIVGSDGVAIIPSATEVTRSRDTHFPFRQDSDFRYLTGFNEPDSVAVKVALPVPSCQL